VLRRVRAAAFPVALASGRLRSRLGRTLLVAGGIAVGAALLAVADGGSAAVRDRAVQRQLVELGPSQASVQAVWSGVPAQSNLSLAGLDRAATDALEPVTGRRPFGVMLLRQASIGGAFVNLGAVDGLGRWLRLSSGRLPRVCRPNDCELVVVRGGGPVPRLPFLHVVGRASFAPDAPLDAYFAPSGKNPPPLLLANGVRGLAAAPLPDVEGIARTYGWVAPVGPGSVHDWEIPGFAARIDRANARLQARSDLFSISAPIDALNGVHADARVAGRRLLLVGGDVALLLLAFAVLVATRLRRDSEAAWRRLSWFGARPAQLATLSAAETGAIAIAGVVIGWAIGIGLAYLFARHFGAPAGAVVRHSVLAPSGLAVAGVLALAAAVVVLVSLRARVADVRGFTLTTADVAAVAAVAAVALALARGKADAESLAGGGGTDPVLLLLPGLVVFAFAVVVARLTGPALRLLERGGRRGPVPLRLAVLSLAREPRAAVLTVAFFVVSVAIALFAAVYRTTLVRNQAEQARFAVPADYVLSEDLSRLVTVPEAASPAAYARLGDASQVFRSSGFVSGATGHDFTLLGLPRHALLRVDGWRSDFSSRPLDALAAALQPRRSVAMRGIVLPPAARRVELPVDVRGDQVNLALEVLNPRGDFTVLPLGEPERGRHLLAARLPAAARGGRVVALRLELPLVDQFLAGHRESGTNLSVSNSSQGTLVLGRLRAGARTLAPFRGWVGQGGITPNGASVQYLVNRAAESFFRASQPTDDGVVPVLASPSIAAAADAGGLLPLQVNEERLLARVVGVIRYFPSVQEGDVVVADRDWVSTALNAESPGTASPDEVWLNASGPVSPERPPFDRLTVASQADELERLQGDPLARGTVLLLSATAIVALALALGALLLTAVVDTRDESGELFDLQLQGAAPADVRRHLRVRAVLVAAVGMLGGLAAGAVLSLLVVAVVAVTAQGTSPVPPLEVALDWPLLLVGAAALAVGAGLVVSAATWSAYERAERRRFSEGLA
jgi:hypothetical protein